MFFKKKKDMGVSKMDLFTNKKQELKQEEQRIKELKKEIIEPMEEEQEETTQIDNITAEVRFKILVRQLNDVETQIKSGKITDIDEFKRDKVPTINNMVNKADTIKLMLKEYHDAFVKAGFEEEHIQQLKIDAIEGRNNYVYFTI